jgi:hypothetical protein
MIWAAREWYRRITIGLGTSKFYLPKGQNLKKFVKLIQRLWEKLKKMGLFMRKHTVKNYYFLPKYFVRIKDLEKLRLEFKALKKTQHNFNAIMLSRST